MDKMIHVLAIALVACGAAERPMDLSHEENATVVVNSIRAIVKDVTGEHPQNGRCTGFYIGAGQVITAYHCVKSMMSWRVEFLNGHVSTGVVKTFSAELDVALLQLTTPPEGVEPVHISKKRPVNSTPVYVIGHPRIYGSDVGWAFFRGYVVGVHKTRPVIMFASDVYKGHSGAPLFHNGSVIGVVAQMFGHTTSHGEIGIAILMKEVCEVLRTCNPKVKP